MANTIAPAGFIVVDNEAIWGAGSTEGAAWDNMESEMRMAGITILDDEADYPENGGSYTRASNFKIRPASAALIAWVDTFDGDTSWDTVNGVCCAPGEAEAEG